MDNVNGIRRAKLTTLESYVMVIEDEENEERWENLEGG